MYMIIHIHIYIYICIYVVYLLCSFGLFSLSCFVLAQNRTPLGELTDSSANVAAGNLKDIKVAFVGHATRGPTPPPLKEMLKPLGRSP